MSCRGRPVWSRPHSSMRSLRAGRQWSPGRTWRPAAKHGSPTRPSTSRSTGSCWCALCGVRFPPSPDRARIPCLRRGILAQSEELRVAAYRAGPGGCDVEQLVPLQGFAWRLALDLTGAGKLLQDGDHDRLGVDVEVAARGSSGVGEAEAVGAERRVLPGDPATDLIRDGAHEVRD